MQPVSMDRREIELLIFDCDGVLIDSEIISANVLINQLEAVGVAVGFDYVQQHFLGRSFPWVVSEIGSRFGITLPPDFEGQHHRDLLIAFENDLRTMDGVEAVLSDLGVSTCVATSSSPSRVERCLELAGLAERFGTRVFTASEVEKGKPAPDLFLHAARSIGVEPRRCLVIEDSLSGLQAAMAADMPVLRYVGGSHLKSARQKTPDDLARIPVFEHWSDFFELAPELRREDDRIRP